MCRAWAGKAGDCAWKDQASPGGLLPAPCEDPSCGYFFRKAIAISTTQPTSATTAIMPCTTSKFGESGWMKRDAALAPIIIRVCRIHSIQAPLTHRSRRVPQPIGSLAYPPGQSKGDFQGAGGGFGKIRSSNASIRDRDALSSEINSATCCSRNRSSFSCSRLISASARIFTW